MSLTVSLRAALASLNATQSQMQIVSNNVANASTEGYTKKFVETKTQIVNGQGSGVRLSDVERTVDQNLLRQLREQLARVANLESRNAYFGRIQDLFGAPGNNADVSHLLGSLTASVEALSASPELAAARHNVATDAFALADRLNTLNTEIQLMRRELDTAIAQTVTSINDKLAIINTLNRQISDAAALQRSTAELEDARDKTLAELSELIDIQSFTRGSGQIVVFTGAGRPLVDSGIVSLTHTPVATMDASVNYPNVIDKIGHGPGGIDITTEISDGKLAGLIEMRDQRLTELQAEFDRLSEVLVATANAAHNAGSAFPPQQTLTSTNSFAGTDAPGWTGTFRVTIVDTSGAVVETQDIALGGVADTAALVAAVNGMANATASIDPNGKILMSATGTNRIAINEMTSQVTTGNQTTGLAQFLGLNDLFTLNSNFANYTADPQTSDTVALGLAGTLTVSYPGGATPIAYGAGDSLATIAANITAALAAQNITATVIQENGKFRLTLTDTDGDNFFITDSGALAGTLNLRNGQIGAASRIALRSDIRANPNILSTGQLSSAPTLAVGDFVLSAGDNDALNALAQALNSDQTFAAAGGLPASSSRLTDYAASIVSLAATQANNVEAQFEVQEGYVEALKVRNAAISEVNIDEEMSNLMILQNAYQAAARVTQTVSQMMDVLVDIIT